jgi:hypothetical protein
MVTDELGQLGELVAAQHVVLVFVKAVEQHLEMGWRRRATAWCMVTVPTVWSAITLFALPILAARSAIPAAPAIRSATAESLAHGLACLLAFLVAKLAVAILVELLEHPLAHLFAARPIAALLAVFRRLGQCRHREQASRRDCRKKEVPHLFTSLCLPKLS